MSCWILNVFTKEESHVSEHTSYNRSRVALDRSSLNSSGLAMKKTVSLLLSGTTTYMAVNLATVKVSRNNYSVSRLYHAYRIRPYHVSLVDSQTAILEGRRID